MKPVDPSVDRLAIPTRSPESHGRTDGRTDVEAMRVTASLSSGTCAGGAEDFIGRGERYPIVRSGPRGEIAIDVRRAVYRRDGHRCKFCGNTYAHSRLELDHIVPWSAGGTDATQNLRTLCQPCNEYRSNHADGRDRQQLPVTWWCLDCHGPVDPDVPWWSAEVQRPAWVRAAPPRIEPHDRLTFAYCAYCDNSGYAEVTL